MSNALTSGLHSGFHQGVKTGMSHSLMGNGLKKGLINDTTRLDKVQDPRLLKSSKLPLIFWLADYGVYSGTSITSITNLISGGTTLTPSGSPAYINNGFLNNRSYINFDTAPVTSDRISTTSTSLMNNKREMTIIMLVRLTNTNDSGVFNKTDGSSPLTFPTPGNLWVDGIGGTKLRVTLVGEFIPPGNTVYSTSVYETNPLPTNIWFLLTIKIKMYQPNGPGSELELFINGTKNQIPISSTYYAISSSVMLGTNSPMYFGNNKVSQPNSDIAGAFVTDYYLNSAEQLRIENYFRYYYGYRF